MPLAFIKRHARISGTDDDDYLREILIPAAIETVERDTHHAITPLQYSIDLYSNAKCCHLEAGPFRVARLYEVALNGDETEVDEPNIRHDHGCQVY